MFAEILNKLDLILTNISLKQFENYNADFFQRPQHYQINCTLSTYDAGLYAK